MMSAIQSLTSAPRLNVGCISSMAPPKALAPMKTGSRPKHLQRERKEDDECQGNVEVLAHGAGVLSPYCDGKRRLIWGAQHLNGNASQTRGLWVPVRARVPAGDFQTLAFDFPNQLRYNICYTIL